MIYFPLDSVIGTRIKIESSTGIFPSGGCQLLGTQWVKKCSTKFPLYLNQIYLKANDAKLGVLGSDTLVK